MTLTSGRSLGGGNGVGVSVGVGDSVGVGVGGIGVSLGVGVGPMQSIKRLLTFGMNAVLFVSLYWAPLVPANASPSGSSLTSVLDEVEGQLKLRLTSVPMWLLFGRGGTSPVRQPWLTATSTPRSVVMPPPASQRLFTDMLQLGQTISLATDADL